MEPEILFTSASLIDFLSKIDELSGLEIQVIDTAESYSIKVGDSIYKLIPKDEIEVEVDEEVIEDIAEGIDEAYNELAQSDLFDSPEDAVEGGPIKELLKTLFIGGLVRMGSKALGKDIARGAAKGGRR